MLRRSDTDTILNSITAGCLLVSYGAGIALAAIGAGLQFGKPTGLMVAGALTLVVGLWK